MREGDPNILVDLTNEASAFQAEITRSALESAGIPAFATTTAGTGLAWELAGVMPMRVQVRRADLDAARKELATIRQEAASIDWSQQDVGVPDFDEPAAVAAPALNWHDKYTERRSFAQLVVFFTCASMYVQGVIIALIMAVLGFIGGMIYG